MSEERESRLDRIISQSAGAVSDERNAEIEHGAMSPDRAGPPDDTIVARQNTPLGIELLAAQRQLYAEAKRWRRLRSWAATGTAVIGLAITLLVPDLAKAVGVLSVLVAVLQLVGREFEKRRIKLAASVQEKFDTSVYRLDPNPLLGATVDAEEIVAAARRLTGDRTELTNWYSVPEGVPRPLDILLCQRSNLRWDAALRRAYAGLLVAGVAAICMLVLAVAIARDLSMSVLWSTLAPLFGLGLFAGETAWNHYQHSLAQFDLKKKVEDVCQRACERPRSVKTSDLRAIQDGIYRLRVTAPPIPDEFYRKKRQQFEHEMREAVERLWQEFSRRATHSGLQER